MSSGPIPVDPPAKPIDGPASAQRPPALEGFGEVRRASRSNVLRWALPIAVVLGAVLIAAAMFRTAPRPTTAEPAAPLPLVRVATVQSETLRMHVVAHGSVAPRTESDLVAEVRGRIVQVAPALVAGGFFSAGDELLRFDDRELSIAVDRARAQVKLRTSESRLAAAEAKRRVQLASRGAASASDLEQFESRALVAEASLDEARAALRQAELDLERTVIRAPFDGRVRDREVDVGQFVNPGTKLARVYAVDYAEVRLPVAIDDLAHLGLGFEGKAGAIEGSPITLRAQLGGRVLEWPATLVRTEGEIDLRTRTLYLVARVDDPYARATTRVSPLPSGLFVEAEIEGRELAGVFVVPALAVRDDDQVYVVDGDDRLVVRPVEIVRREADRVVIGRGLTEGERIIVSPLRAVSEGMQLRTVEADAS